MATKSKVNEKLYSYREAAKYLGMHFSTVMYYVQKGYIKTTTRLIKAQGITKDELRRFRDQYRGFGPTKRKKTMAIIKEYLAGGQSLKQVGKKYGVSESWVSYLVKRHKAKQVKI